MFCICCLEESGRYIKLNNCVHGDYLEKFSIPNLNPPLEQVICYQCHSTLKKINNFKLQVEESFSLLLKEADKIESRSNKSKNIAISKIVHLNIPDGKTDIEIINIKNEEAKIKNIETALEIINNNSTSLQTLAICNLKTITETLLEATTDNLNFESVVLPQNELARKVLPEQNNDIKKEVFHPHVVLPLNIKNEIDNNSTELQENNKNDFSNKPASVIRKEKLTVKLEIDIFADESIEATPSGIPEKHKNTKLITDTEGSNNDCQMPVLPVAIKKEPDVVITDVYGTAVLPDTKSEPTDPNDIVYERDSVIEDPYKSPSNDGDPTRESATYNCPWEKHSFLKSIPTIEDCPSDLFIVRAKDIFKGKCNLLKDMGKSVGIIGIRGTCAS